MPFGRRQSFNYRRTFLIPISVPFDLATQMDHGVAVSVNDTEACMRNSWVSTIGKCPVLLRIAL